MKHIGALYLVHTALAAVLFGLLSLANKPSHNEFLSPARAISWLLGLNLIEIVRSVRLWIQTS